MKQAQSQAADIGLEEQNYILKAIKDLKDSIFNVLYVLLDNEEGDEEEDQSMWGLVFESGLDYLQMLAFPFNETVMDAWNGGETLENVSLLFSKLNIMSYLPGVSFDTFLILLYSLVFVIILVLIDIVYVSYSFSKKRFRFTWPLIILAKLVPLFVTIFFLPITQTLLSVVQCKSDDVRGGQVMESFPDIICWQGWHLFHSVVTLLFTSLFVIISSVVALALFEPRMTSKKLTARQNSTGQVIFIFNKIICQLIFSFNPFKQKWIYSAILFGLSGSLYWTYNMNDPFYEKKVSKFFRIVSSYYFWTNFMLLVSQVLSPLGFNGGLVIWISGLPFIGIIIAFQHRSSIDQLFSFNLKFKSGEQLESHLRYVLQLLKNQDEDKNSYMLVTGYIQKHKEICVEDDCPLKMVKKLNKQNSEKEDLNEKFLLQIERMYKLGIKKYPNCTRLRISFAFFLLQKLKNKNKAYEQFSYALKTEPTFEEEFIIYRFKKIIRQNLQKNGREEDTVDLIEIIRFDNHISLCQEAMLRSARLHKDFWAQLKEETPDLKKLNVVGSKITKTINVVKQNYDEIDKINNAVPEVLYCYSLYLLMVTRDSVQGKRLLETSRKIYNQKMSVSKKTNESDELTENQLQNAYQPLITVSVKPGSIGKVLNLNSLFSELSGYQRQEIVQRNFQKILPEIFKDIHQQKIREWIQSEQPSGYVNSDRQGYIKLKSGFVLPVEYQVYYKSSTESFTVVFKNNSQYRNCCHLIIDAQKIIRQSSILGQVYFGLDKWKINDNEINAENYFGLKDFEELVQKNKGAPFEFKIEYQNSLIPCEICIKEVNMKIKEINGETENEDEQRQMLSFKDKLLGYYLRITIKNSEKIDMLNQLKDNEEQLEDYGDESERSGIMSLYDDPNLLDILISNLAETKTQQEKLNRFELKYKIKTMRLLNNEIKMVYNQNSNGDFENNEHEETQEDDLQMLKLNDKKYHQKIRSAINTKLNHIEVEYLKKIGFAFILTILGLTIAEMILSLEIFSYYQNRSGNLLSLSEQTNYLSKYLTATLDPNVNHTEMLTVLQKHQINRQNDELVIQIELSNGQKTEIGIFDAFIYFYSKLSQFFKVGGQLNIELIYMNFINAIYPAVDSMNFQKTQTQETKKTIVLSCFSLAAFFSLLVLMLWIIIRLRIEKKKADILLWFLDIPISYVAYLGQNCDNYLKNFVNIKEVMNKNAKIEEDPYIEDYQQLKGKQQEIEEQQKARKTLILKQRKLTFCSRLSWKHLKLLWIVVFGMIYSAVAITEIYLLENYEQFLKEQWMFSSRSILWANSIHISWYLLQSGHSNVQGISIQDFSKLNLEKFENTMSVGSLHSFNYHILSKQGSGSYYNIVKTYSSVYYSDLCSYLNQSNTRCGTIVNASLRGGYRVYSMYLRNNDGSKKQEIRQANENYGSVAILNMIETWEQSMMVQVSNAQNLVSIIFYVYIVAGMLFFMVIGLLYLNKVNTQINEAIRMLNMIPFKLLSSSRKETRSFIIWIIRQANKKKHMIE